MYAIVDISGKQFKVEPNLELKVPSQRVETGKKVSYENVLLLDNGKRVTVGTPFVKGTTVKATVLEHGREKKIIVFKKKRRKGYKSKNTHRQGYTRIRVDGIIQKRTGEKTAPPKTKKTKKE